MRSASDAAQTSKPAPPLPPPPEMRPPPQLYRRHALPPPPLSPPPPLRRRPALCRRRNPSLPSLPLAPRPLSPGHAPPPQPHLHLHLQPPLPQAALQRRANGATLRPVRSQAASVSKCRANRSVACTCQRPNPQCPAQALPPLPPPPHLHRVAVEVGCSINPLLLLRLPPPNRPPLQLHL
jgi:hypothetical protein